MKLNYCTRRYLCFQRDKNFKKNKSPTKASIFISTKAYDRSKIHRNGAKHKSRARSEGFKLEKEKKRFIRKS